MKNRRRFFKLSLAGVGLIAFNSLGKKAFATKSTKKMESSFIHQVYFWLKDPDNEDVRKRFEEGLRLLDTTPTIRESHIGIPPKSERKVVDGSFTYSYLAIFNCKEDHDAYQKHPTHHKFKDEYLDLMDRVQIYDSVDA